MVSSSKILTVSYGTFSCTAEGFDDPMEVVKETTHFFRGVVGEDRFFGAEPPQFDPELATEYLRDRMADTGGTLSLGSPPRVMAAAASAGAMAAAMSRPASHADELLPDDDTIEATAVLAETLAPDAADLDHEAVLDDLVPDGPEAAPAPHASAPDGIAAKLDRIRAVVAQISDTDAEDDAPDMSARVENTLTDAAEVKEPLFDETPEEMSLIEETPEDEVPVEEARIDEPLVEETRDDALESLLDELVVESGDAESTDLGDDLDREDDDYEDDDNDSVLDAAVASLMATDDDKDENDAPADALPLAAAVSAVAALATGQTRDDDDVGYDDDDAFEPETAARDSAEIDQDDHDDTDTIEAVEAALGRSWSAEEGPLTPRSAPKAEAAEPPEPATQAAPLRARVVKVKRAAFEQAIDDGMLEEVPEVAPEQLSPPPVATSDISSLSPDEEEELARELAAVKAELASDFGAWDDDDTAPDPTFASTMPGMEDAAPDDTDDTAVSGHAAPLRLDNPIAAPQAPADADPDSDMQSSARKAVKLASPARALLTEHEVEDGDTSRLMDQTDSAMDEPEGNRRRSAIAHLRAAVAATKADRLLGQKADAADEQEPYREDLASVVRPRRPQSVTRPTERPETHVPTPLKLVAEQRVVATEDSGPDAGPVRPRRVRRTDPVPQTATEESGFAAFAADVGVKGLPELLEAAAAYMSYVEGRDQFSRPQLMTTLRQAEVSDSSREDRLRSFGQLLREGKIRKTSGGRFTAAETISFKPAATG
ncbi:hypothetical protein [Antarctobacter heliothermus]|uniref:Lipoprotein n=1 Tax=Antarctobacter heliothermus TaxID=74033 RepID=A0A239CPI3_9RHOB|nr:hypothetical protein [Antarctobacter heliothermus]SNS21601.1 hypothetical protein SAMN04488078_100791 [Antarctobacter heliothermus]